jgi:hypothetical protein
MTEKKTNRPDKETIRILKGISKNFDIPMPDIKARFTKTLASRPIQNLNVPSEPERERHAVRVVMAELTGERDRKEFSGKVAPVIIRIESKESISDFKRTGTDEIGYRAGMFVTMQDEDENIAIAKLTLWNDACEIHPNLVIGETYSTSVVIGNRGSVWETSMNDPTEVEDSDIVLKPMSELITENFTPISISEVENNISKDRNDPKLVEGIVVSGWQKVTSNNRDMGFLKLMGDITDLDEVIIAKFSGDANCVNNVGAGDLVYVLGQTTPAVLNDDGSIQYDIGMWGELIIPILVTEHTEDTDTNAEEGSEEHKEEETGNNTNETGEDPEESLESKIDEW